MTVEFGRPPDVARHPLTECSRLATEQGDAELGQLAAEAAQGTAEKDHAHQVMRLTLEDAADGDALQKARPVSWRFILGKEDRHVAVEVQCDMVTYHHHFSDISEGPVVEGTLQAIEQAKKDPQFEREQYTVGLVRLPALHFQALWLQNYDAALERFIPIPPTHPEVRDFEVYDANSLNQLLKKLAGEMKSAMDPLDDLLGG